MEEGKKKVLITGADGFIAKNLVYELKNREYDELYLCNRATSEEQLKDYLGKCNAIVHLAGVNRPLNEDGYKENISFTEKLLLCMEGMENKKLIFASSIQAELDNAYGRSKRQAEIVLMNYAREHDLELFIHRLPNVFGKWCRPNYNSVVATFCYNIARGLEITIHNPDSEIKLVYIDDVINAFIDEIEGKNQGEAGFVEDMGGYKVTVGELAKLIQSFAANRRTLELPNMSDTFQKKLYSTYLSYLEADEFKYELKMNVDARGSFTEFLRSDITGQVSVNVAKPGIVKGNHWHHTKVEKFLVVSGTASIKFRHMITGEVTEYIVSGDKLEVVDIPVGYTHNITNIGTGDLVTVMWTNEAFDKEHPDTFYEEV